MYIVALTHTEGVILNNKYIILELAYQDMLGLHKHFLIQSPICYTKAKMYNKYLKKSLEVIMCTSYQLNGHKVYKFSEILEFLKERYAFLQYFYSFKIHFGYKGRSFQRNILSKCNIPNINIECFGIPPIRTLLSMYPYITKNCCYHKHYYNKCAEHILRLINAYFWDELHL